MQNATGSTDRVVIRPVVEQAQLLAADTILVETGYSVVVPGQENICSLVGRVVEIGPELESLAVGDPVIALGPLAASLTLPAAGCLKLPEAELVTEEVALWALTLALIPAIRFGQLEIGETVLVLSTDLVGQMLVDLALLAGAVSCIAFDPEYSDSSGSTVSPQAQIAPQWVNDVDALATRLPDRSVDLLIDATGDPVWFQGSLSRVRDMGRMLLLGQGSQSQYDFNFYPDLHKRSLKFLSCPMPQSLSSDAGKNLDYVRHLYRTKHLPLSPWSIKRLQSPDDKTLQQTLQTKDRVALLVQW